MRDHSSWNWEGTAGYLTKGWPQSLGVGWGRYFLMPLPRPDGKVGPSNDVVPVFDPDTLCHALWGSVTSSACAGAVRAGLQALAPGSSAGLGSRE